MIERELYLKKILPFMEKPLIKILSGMRRSGKSTILNMLKNKLIHKGVPEKNIIYINKELLEFEFISNYTDLNNYVKNIFKKSKKQKYVFIDEVQEIENWEKAINSFLASGDIDIYLTGSNSRMLSSELATLLTGRYVVIPIFPLSFQEFLRFRKASASYEQEFENYLKYGGLPGIHFLQLDESVVFQYLDSIYNTILLKDIVTRYNIRDVSMLERVTNYLFDNCGNITSSKKISDYIKSQRLTVGVETIQNYISHLRDAYLFFKASRFDIKGKKHLELFEKYFASDLGIRHSILGYKGNDISGNLENIVFLELLRRGFKVSIGKFDDFEIDFVAEKEGEKMYIQVCYLLESKETENREFRPLEKINDNYPKLVLSMDKIWGKDRNGIKRENIIDFLQTDLPR